MQISKKFFCFLILSSLLLFSNSTGFDLYHHAISYYFNNESINHGYLLTNEIILPRYFFLSVIYELFSKVGLPLGWVALFLTLFPLYSIFYSSYFLNKKRNPIYELFLLIFLIYLIFIYAALNLAVIWLLAYFFSQRKLFLLGALFHPAALILYLLVLVIMKRIKHLFFFILIFFFPFIYLMYISTQYNILTSHSFLNIKETIDLDNLYYLLSYTYNSKLHFFVYPAIIFFIIYIATKKKNFFSLLLKLNSKLFFYVPYLVAILIVIFMLQKSTFLNYFFSKENLSIYVTWLQFGKNNLEFDFYEVNCSRYYDYKNVTDNCL
jgi:hypothetical protein